MQDPLHHLHPLDWAGYLRRSLVLSSTPTALTLLVLVAHYHACCSPSSEPIRGLANETSSVLGTVFAAASPFWAATLLMVGNRTTHCIQTPWLHKQQQEQGPASAQQSHQAPPIPSEEEDEEHTMHEADGRKAPTFADGLLQASMRDPFSIAYSAWESLFAAVPEQVRIQMPPDGQKAPPKPSSSCEWMMRREQTKRGRKEVRDRETRRDAIWVDVCAMHAVGLLGVLCALLPSVLLPGVQRQLACNAAIPAVRASAWPLINCCALLFCLSWVACATLQHAAGQPELAMCTAMHLVASLLMAFADVTLCCPLPPVYAPRSVSSMCWLCVCVNLN